MDPLLPIGIAMPAHDAAPWIGQAIASVLAQTLPDWRLAVVDDGSADATAAIAARFADARIRLIRQPRAGVSCARNRAAAALADAGSLLFLDADDLLAPEALARLRAALRAAPASVAATGPFAPVTEAGVPAGRVRRGAGGALLERLLTRNLFANGGQVLIRAEAAASAGPFHPALRFAEDWEYWVRLALRGPFVVAPGRAPVLFVRRRAAGAYLGAAADPAAFAPALDAAYTNPALIARIGPARLARLRARMAAEAEWVAGRAALFHGGRNEALGRLRRAFAARPRAHRAALLAWWHLAGITPAAPPPTARATRRP